MLNKAADCISKAFGCLNEVAYCYGIKDFKESIEDGFRHEPRTLSIGSLFIWLAIGEGMLNKTKLTRTLYGSIKQSIVPISLERRAEVQPDVRT